ncbi:radical SAM protein [Candidatus Bathyarchaeota archaeon]|nr:radical SAM protein [Candidatus Bathyarchaeota archaeon]
MIVYGPVPSRRLGRSLGVNHVPPKTCTYSCVYCQLGHTDNLISERRHFYDPEFLAASVKKKVEAYEGEIDYITFVPDGEPTLDIDLGKDIEMVKGLGIKVAVICNSSMLWREDVKNDLINADWVSLKVDAINSDTWVRVDRPHGKLNHVAVLEGMRDFASVFKGTLSTETMLINGLNDGGEPEDIAIFLKELDPDISYVAIPTRPPAEDWVKPADEEAVNKAYQVFSRVLRNVEYLIGYEGNAFASTGNFEEDILSITAVHPMREDAVKDLLRHDGASWEQLERLNHENKIVKLSYLDKNFYMRRISSRSN